MFVRDGLAYVREGRLIRGLTVYDVRDPSRPRRVGHYSRPNEIFQRIAPLPGARVLLAGRNLHVVAPPQLD